MFHFVTPTLQAIPLAEDFVLRIHRVRVPGSGLVRVPGSGLVFCTIVGLNDTGYRIIVAQMFGVLGWDLVEWRMTLRSSGLCFFHKKPGRVGDNPPIS